MAFVENNVNKSYMTEVISSKKDEKIAELKKEQDEKRTSLFSLLEQQRKVYSQAKKEYAAAKMEYGSDKSRLNSTQRSEYTQNKNQERFEMSEASLYGARKNQDKQLSILISRTDDFCSANRISIFDMQ